MAVLISGASGFLGSRLIKRLAAEGADVVALGRRPAPEYLMGKSNVRWFACDIARDGVPAKALSDIEAVVHLAGATLGAGTDEAVFLHANEQTTVRLFQALADRTDRFVFSSSQVVYGDARHIAVTEDFPLDPSASAYACSKLNSENWLRWFQKRHGGQYLALRFCGFVDGGGLVDYIVDRSIAGDSVELYSRGAVRRDYLPSAEGVDVMIAALRFSGEPGFLPINVGSGQAVSAHELAKQVCIELGSPSRIELLDKASPQGDFVFSGERARRLLGFQPGNLIEAVRHHARRRADRLRSAGDE